MMRDSFVRNVLVLFFTIFYVAPTAVANVATQTCPKQVRYKFENGDTLSEVLWAVGSWRLYGPRGRIARIVAASPHKFSDLKKGFIRSGVVVKISVQFCPDPRRWSIEDGFLVRVKFNPDGTKSLPPEYKPDSTNPLVPPDNSVPSLIPIPATTPTQTSAPTPSTPLEVQSVPTPPPQLHPVHVVPSAPAVTPIPKRMPRAIPPSILEPVRGSLPKTKELTKELNDDSLSEFVND